MYILELKNIELEVYLGVYSWEQEVTTKIAVDVSLSFLSQPLGCYTDDLKDTICYDRINQEFQSAVVNKRYALIEYLTQNLLDVLKKLVKNALI